LFDEALSLSALAGTGRAHENDTHAKFDLIFLPGFF
jgi:hypothetical protein